MTVLRARVRQVLRRRDEESTITKSQQKRKLNKLQDVFNGLRQRLAEQERSQRIELQQLTTDIRWEPGGGSTVGW